MTHKTIVTFIAAAASLTAVSARAQASQAAPPEPDRDHSVSEVMVTAKRREERLQDVPMAVTAVTDKQLRAVGATQISEYFRTVPGLALVDRGPSYKKYILRGVNSENAPALQSVVQQYIDDFPLNASGVQPDVRLYDVDRVEVLRGPQGTLYGAAAMAGTIRTIMRKPDLAAFGGYVDAKVSATHRGGMNYGVNGAVNIPIVKDILAIRLSLFDDQEDGYIDNLYNRKNNFNTTDVKGGRFNLMWRPTDRLTVSLQYYYQKLVAGGFAEEMPGFTAPTDAGFHGAPGAPPAPGASGPPPSAPGDPPAGGGGAGYPAVIPPIGLYQAYRAHDESISERLQLTNLTVNYDLGPATLTSASTVYGRKNALVSDYSVTGGFGAYRVSAPEHHDFVQEFRLVSNGSQKLHWLVGGYYRWTRFKPSENSNVEFSPQGRQLNEDHSDFWERDFAAFGEATYDLTRTISVIGGLRWSQNGIENHGSLVTTFEANGRRTDFRDTGFTTSESALAPKAQIVWKPRTDRLFYILAAKGTRPGGANSAAKNPLLNPKGEIPATYGQDQLWNYELGAKTAWLNRRLIVNGAAFYIDWRDMQARAFGRDSFLTWNDNVSNARIIGAETETTYQVTRNLGVSLSASALSAELTTDQPGACTAQERAARDPKCRGTIAGYPGKRGDRLPVVPNLSAALQVDYQREIGAGFQYYAHAQWTYTDGSLVQFRPDDPQQDRLKPYALVGLRTGLTREGWTFGAYVDNLTDKHVQVFANTVTSERKKIVIRPRTIGLNLRRDF